MPSVLSRLALPALMVFGGGMAALAHQFLWSRRLIDLLGASNESSTRVFACFFLGLAAGAAIAAWRVAKISSPWRMAAYAEFSVALLSLPVIFLPNWTDWLWPALGTSGLMGIGGTLAKTLFAFIAIFPPACCMGFSFPLIIQAALARSGSERTGSLLLYGLNTLGGALGLLLCLGWMLEAIGIMPSMIVAALSNVLIGLICLSLSRRVPPSAEKAEQASKVTVVSRIPRPAIGLAFISGAITLALEVLGLQMLLLVAPATVITPGVILFAVILTLAIPPLILPWILKKMKRPAPEASLLRLIIPAACLCIVLAPVLFMALARSGHFLGQAESVIGFSLDLISLALLAIGPAWFLLGTLFPLTIAWATKTDSPKASQQAPARTLGILLAVNGAGGFIGAELALHLLLPTTGIYGGIALLGGILALFSLILSGPPRRRILVTGTSLTALIFITILAVRPLPILNPYLPLKLLDEKSGPEGSVAVVEDLEGNRSILMSNQYTLGGSAVRFDQERQALLPLLLHPEPRNVACIGLATGITPGAVLTLSGVDHLTAIELSPLVVRAADQYFSEYNHQVTRSDRATIAIEDGRTYMAAAPDRFDVVCGDLFLPWSPGETRLYSHEHFTAVHDSLRDGGLFCQWLAMYQLTEEQYEMIAATFASVFPDCQLFINHFRGDSPMLGLVGWKNPADSHHWRKTVAQRIESLSAAGEITDPILRHPTAFELLALGPWHPRKNKAHEAPALVRLNDPALEFSAARERLSGNPGKKYYFMTRWFKFCHHLRARNIRNTQTVQLGTALHSFELATAARHPAAKDILNFLRSSLPKRLLQDQSADWTRWPGSVSLR